jgi:hypothetical protein
MVGNRARRGGVFPAETAIGSARCPETYPFRITSIGNAAVTFVVKRSFQSSVLCDAINRRRKSCEEPLGPDFTS